MAHYTVFNSQSIQPVSNQGVPWPVHVLYMNELHVPPDRWYHGNSQTGSEHVIKTLNKMITAQTNNNKVCWMRLIQSVEGMPYGNYASWQVSLQPHHYKH